MSGNVYDTPPCPCGCESRPDPSTGIYELCADAERRDEMAAADTPLQDGANMPDDGVVTLIADLRQLAEQANRYGLMLRADVYGQIPGSTFDGLAALADEVRSVQTLGSGPGIRAATWKSSGGWLPASEVTLVELRRAA